VVLTRRNIAKTLREPDSLLDVTVIPIVFILLFGYVIGPAISLAFSGGGGGGGGGSGSGSGSGGGSGSHLAISAFHSYLVPGMLAFTIVNTARGTAVAIAEDMGGGIIDRFRSLPMSRAGVLLGRSVADLATMVLAVAVVAATGLAIGWRPHHGADQTVVALALVLLFGYALDWAMLCLGLIARSGEGAEQIGLLLLFLLGLVSTALVPVSHMAAWLRSFAYWNPVSVLATACRHLFGNPNPAATASSWAMQHAVAASLIWSAAIFAVFAPLAIQLYRTRASR
jgi:ABC transporter DrrB family efflux protein